MTTEPIFGNVLTQFDNGVQLDLRVKLAIEFLKAPSCQHGNTADATVTYALALADSLVRQGQELNFIKPLPEDDQLSAPLRRHIRRNLRAQIYQQVAGQEIQREEMPHVQHIQQPLPGMQS